MNRRQLRMSWRSASGAGSKRRSMHRKGKLGGLARLYEEVSRRAVGWLAVFRLRKEYQRMTSGHFAKVEPSFGVGLCRKLKQHLRWFTSGFSRLHFDSWHSFLAGKNNSVDSAPRS